MAIGTYHADNGDAPAIKVADGDTADDGTDTDNIVVFSDGSHGSGLDGGTNNRDNVKRGDDIGEWTPG
jgi:hypothetical protein